MDSTRVQPVSGAHAIEVMAIGVEWGVTPLDDTQLAALQAVYQSNEKLKTFLPTLLPVQTFALQAIGQLGVVGSPMPINLPPQFSARNGGFDLQRFDTAGKAEWIVSVRPEFISVNCTNYDRWMYVKPKALDILLPFVEAATQGGAKINAIGLQYQDAFRLLDGASQATTEYLFRNNGKYLPTHFFEQSSLWHCHQGWFSKTANQRRVLNNVAIEVAEVNNTHFARIGGQHRIFAISVDGTNQIHFAVEEIDEILQYLHNENKNLINGILSDDALKSIGCTKENS